MPDAFPVANSISITAWLIDFLGDRAAGLQSGTAVQQPFEVLGMDSVECLMATMGLENHFGLTLDPSLFLRNPDLQGALAELMGDGTIPD